MAFKMRPPYEVDNTPVYRAPFEEGTTHGVTLMNGSIVLNENLPHDMEEDTVEHEKIHVQQIKEGRFSWDDDYVCFEGKKYDRSKIKEGDKNLPWEKEAYAKQKKV
jgi:hypothetical protein